MSDVSQLGGGYAESAADPLPTAAAVEAAARPGSAESRLVILAGPPGVGKSAVAAGLVAALPNGFWVDKDTTAAGFILQAAAAAGLEPSAAYGTPQYWGRLRPLEYAGSIGLACANLIGDRVVIQVGGWGPELGVEALWPRLAQRIAPTRLEVVHLDPPPLEDWRQRMARRGSRCDSPWFDRFAQAVGALPVWDQARRINTDRPLRQVVQAVLQSLNLGAKNL